MSDFHALVSGSQSAATWRSVHDRIVTVCEKVWQEMKPVLCIDSPEGHSDEPMEDLSVGPKDILSYSWRALRESRCVLPALCKSYSY